MVRSITQFKRLISDSYDALKEAGVRGGVVVPHGYRVKADVKAEWRALKDDGQTEKKLWHWIRESDRDWRSMTYWSPHIHCIGLATEVEPVESDEWIVERLSTFGKFNLYDEDCYRDMAKAYSYILSHLSFDPDGGGHAIRWFGTLANNQFSLESLEDWERTKLIRMVAEVMERPAELDGDDEPGLHEECPCDDCEGHMRPIYDAGDFLMMPTFCQSLDRDTERRLSAAFRWAIGDVGPPPGLKHPKTEAEACEIMDILVP
jgi:hypothetical protein